MSGNSNLGYATQTLNAHINPQWVRTDGSQYSAHFSSNQISGTPPGPLPGLAGTKDNVDAAASRLPMRGGAWKRKIKNIAKHYKTMRAGSRRIRRLKSRLRNRSRQISRKISRGRARSMGRASFIGGRRRNKTRTHRRRSHRRQRGGQYMSNQPVTQTYQVAGIPLNHQNMALATPTPVTVLDNCVNCVDNYNHYLRQGTSS